MNNLVIVESNAKASKIKGYLDSKFPEDNWQVNACLGHICDLPNEEKAVNPDDWEDLKWADTTKGKKVIKELTKLCKENDSIFLATDPAREGEGAGTSTRRCRHWAPEGSLRASSAGGTRPRRAP